MAEKNLPVGESIEILYQAPNAESGLDVRADIYDELKAPFSVDNPLAEVGDTGTYRGSFTPDEQGEWEAVIYKFVDSNTRDGQVTKRYSVGAHNVHSVGEKANNIQTKVDEIDTTVDGIDLQLDGMDTKLDDIDTKVGSLDTPPMVS